MPAGRTAHPDIVIVGAGIIGAACAEALSARGLKVTVLDRSAPASGTTASGEGNVLVSDRVPGPELELGLLSRKCWPRLLDRLRAELGEELADVEWDTKGGLVVATEDASADALTAFAATQRDAGVAAVPVSRDTALELEPLLSRSVCAAVHYPDDAQVQPVLAATGMLAALRRRGGTVRAGVSALGIDRDSAGAVSAVRTSDGTLPCAIVINAGGPWSARFAADAGAPIAVSPRRGMVLVTAPLPNSVRHKVYDADYVGAVTSDDATLQTSTVVESTGAGTVLIGSSRQRIGFDDAIRPAVLRRIASSAIRLFPVLAGVSAIRAYGGFRPYTADHLPVIGPDPRVPGLWHVTGHEGGGIGLAAGTGALVADLAAGTTPRIDPAPFRVDRPGLVPDTAARDTGTTAGGLR